MSGARPAFGRALNLPALARSAAGEPIAVPGWPLSVQHLLGPRTVEGTHGAWLVVMSGEAIVDLPGGDFRVLKAGDALSFPAGAAATLRNVAVPAILVWHVGG